MTVRTILAISLTLFVAACGAPAPEGPKPSDKPVLVAKGLVPLPCADAGPLRPHSGAYCLIQRHYVRAGPREALMRMATRMQARFPGTAVRYMEASWPLGKRPMPPHLSHGDGRQIDLALFYVGRTGRPLARPPTRSGYNAFEPPRTEGERRCVGREKRRGANDAPDPAPDRRWRLDGARSTAMVRMLAADPHVRRIFIEPHLKRRLGLSKLSKVRFAGCRAARHDDHIHVDFF